MTPTLGATPTANDALAGYMQQFSNVFLGKGNDPTNYFRFGLINFAFGTYDGVTTAPQPISGGFSVKGFGDDELWWYPAKDPLTERWDYDTGGADSGWYGIGAIPPHEAGAGQPQYDTVTWAPNGIICVGGEKANGLTRYFNDFGFAIDREGTTGVYSEILSGYPQTITGSAPTNNVALSTLDFFPLSTWMTSSWNPTTHVTGQINTFGYQAGNAIISLVADLNGTRSLMVAGWNAQDTYWASAWASQFLNSANNAWVPPGTVALILQMTYPNANSEPTFTLVQCLGTITQFGTNYFAKNYSGWDIVITGGASGTTYPPWTTTLANLWSGTDYPTNPSAWWYQKLPTTTTASIQYDP